MIDVDQATALMQACPLPYRVVTLPLQKTLNRILAEDVFSDMDQPPFHRVAMDGIAINKKLLSDTNRFAILKTIAAGSERVELPAGAVCFEIMTGAVLPLNADMVIRYEDLRIRDGFAEITVDQQKLSSNFHIQGSDYRKGDKVLSRNTMIKSTSTAILASVGKTTVQVYELPSIAILSTGDELVEIDSVPAPHQIRWSNGICLKQELCDHGLWDVSLYKVKDCEMELKKVMEELLSSKDIVLLTGGVSAGNFDFVPKILRECLIHEIFHNVAQRPGKPLWFGKNSSNVFVFGLPGNPVSCLINLRKFVIPFIKQSVPGFSMELPLAYLDREVKLSNKLMTYYCLVKLKHHQGKLIASPISGNGSGDFFQLRDSDGFIELKPQEDPIHEGFLGEVYPWGNSWIP